MAQIGLTSRRCGEPSLDETVEVGDLINGIAAKLLVRDRPRPQRAYRARVELLARDVDRPEAEARAFDYVVGLLRASHGVGLEAAKREAAAAITQSKKSVQNVR